MRIKAEPTVEPEGPYGLIAAAAGRSRRRRRLDALLPALPPCAALFAALLAGCLPLELAVAAMVGLGVLLLYVASVEVTPAAAATFLDRVLGAKEHFLTLATLPGGGDLRAVVEAGAAEIAHQAPEPALPPPRKRPLAASIVLSAAGFALLWLLPNFAAPAASGDSLERIAADLARSPDAADRELGGELREVLRVLADPGSSTEQRLAKVKAAMEEIEAAEQKKGRTGNAGSAAGEQRKGEGGGREATGGQSKGRGTGQQAGAQGKEQGGGGTSDARGRALEQLSKLAGELSAEMQGQAAQTAEKQQKEQKPNAGGGGIQGPQSSAEERKAGSREATGNQPGERPDQTGGGQNQGGEQGEGEAQARAENRSQSQPAHQEGSGAGGGSSAESAGAGSSQAPSRPAPRYYPPGEGPDGRVVDGRYVRIRVPQDQHLLQGTEEVAKPGDVAPKVGYGNAPLPEEGSPGKVSTAQPLPLEYRGALGQGGR